jgi:hypothetical protein
MRQISIAQVNSGSWWPPEDKIEYLSSHSDGKTLRYFESQSPIWMKKWLFFEFVTIKMEHTYRVHLSVEQAVAIFQRPKPKGRSWGEHYIFLVEVSHASGGLPNLVLKSIVKYAAPDMRQMLMARADLEANDWLLQAERLANFAQSVTLDEGTSRTLGREVNAMDSPSGIRGYHLQLLQEERPLD